MNRQLLCRKCGEKTTMHHRDKADGWNMRKRYVSTVMPEGHGITFNGIHHLLGDLVCDNCSEKITGQISVAVTMWRNSEKEPRDWEPEYGTVLADPVVQVVDTLEGKSP